MFHYSFSSIFPFLPRNNFTLIIILRVITPFEIVLSLDNQRTSSIFNPFPFLQNIFLFRDEG